MDPRPILPSEYLNILRHDLSTEAVFLRLAFSPCLLQPFFASPCSDSLEWFVDTVGITRILARVLQFRPPLPPDIDRLKCWHLRSLCPYPQWPSAAVYARRCCRTSSPAHRACPRPRTKPAASRSTPPLPPLRSRCRHKEREGKAGQSGAKGGPEAGEIRAFSYVACSR